MPSGYKTCRNPECRELVASRHTKCWNCGFNFNGEQVRAAEQIQQNEAFEKRTSVADLYPLKSHSREQLELLANTNWSKELANAAKFLNDYGSDIDKLFRTAKKFNNDYEQISLAARSLLNCQLS